MRQPSSADTRESDIPTTGIAVTEDRFEVARATRLLATIARRIGGSLALDDTLTAVVDAVVEALGFRAAVVNLLEDDGELHVVAVAGSSDIREALCGTHSSRAAWDAIFTASVPWGDLRFLSHETNLPEATGDMHFYVPPLEASSAPNAWHPQDALFAPLLGGDGCLLGVLSVDDPIDGVLPSESQRELLEAFALHAALAIEHARQHKSLADSELLMRRLFDESPIGKALVGLDGRFRRVNEAYCEFLGRPATDFIGSLVTDFAHPEERKSTAAVIAGMQDGLKRPPKIEKRYLRADGTELWGRLTLTRIGDGADATVLASIEDITDAREAEAQLRHNALHDSLTGLPNRTLIFDRLEQALVRSRRLGTGVAVAVVDVDHFKAINDTYGHPVGDQLLVAVATALHSGLRDTDTAGRLGGDEFVVVCEGVDSVEGLAMIADRLHNSIRIPVEVDGLTLLPSASIGCTLSDDFGTADDLVAQADAALYRAKAAGRGRYEMFDDEMRRTSVEQSELRAQLLAALQRGEFRLHYQPVVRLDGRRLAGVEALLRWDRPGVGLVEPAQFLPALFDSDLDVPVAQWVLRQACVDLVELSDVTGSNPFLCINVSARQLGRPEFISEVRAALHEAGLAAQRLWLDITESHLVDRKHRPMVEQLAALGCQIALDDFGTGYSGLAYLRELPVSAIKIDRVFIGRVGADRISTGITAAVAGLAGVLQIPTVAEGVETEEQAELVRAMGVGLAQGYLFSRPVPLVELCRAQALLTTVKD